MKWYVLYHISFFFSYPALFPKFHGAMGGPHGHPGGLLGAAAAAAAMSAAGSVPHMGRPHGYGAGGPPVPPLDDDDVKGSWLNDDFTQYRNY